MLPKTEGLTTHYRACKLGTNSKPSEVKSSIKAMTSNFVHPNQIAKVLDSLERTGYAEYDIYTTEVQNA